MEPKPAGWSRRHAAVFEHRSAAESYRNRPPYPAATIDLLAELAGGGPLLDAGCGPGDLGRPLACRVERVDAADASAAMLAVGRAAPGGDVPNLRWLEARIEEAPLEPPYALVVAGDSIHWFDWEVALPRFAAVLGPRGLLAVVQRTWEPDGETLGRLSPIYARHGSPDYVPLDPVVELERRGLFRRIGRHRLVVPWRPTVAELLAAHHSMSAFVVERLADPAAFDRELLEVLETLPRRGEALDLEASATVGWGRPAA